MASNMNKEPSTQHRLTAPMELAEAIDHFEALGHKRKEAMKLAERYVKDHPVMVPPGVVVVIAR